MSIRAVLFDLGDTLIFEAREPDGDRLYGRMAQQVLPLLRAWRADDRVDAAALLRDLYDAVHTAQPLRREQGFEVDGAFIARGALAAYGVEASAEQALAFWRATATSFIEWGWQPYPDTLDTLHRVRSLGLSSALVSNSWNSSDLLVPLLDEYGITRDLLDVIVSSADLMRPKPRPEPFERALAALGVSPGEAVFVGDDLDADIRGAKALGITTAWKLNGRHELPPAPEADHTIHDLWELFGLGLLPAETSAALPQQSLMPHEDDNKDRY